MKSFNIYIIVLLVGLLSFSSCNDFLDKEPTDQITPDTFLRTDSDLGAYSLKQYDFTTHGGGIGIWSLDNHTDNQATSSYASRWIPGEWRVSDKPSGDAWEFTKIYNCNYFLDIVLPRYNEGSISGSKELIDHYIGEIYFLRAWNYFSKLKTFGDFPIVEKVLPDDKPILVEASKRQPRHKVARFILSDLDKAIELLSVKPAGGTNRISKNVAYLIKSRVALYEASWQTYHANTALVPNGTDYAGEAGDYNATAEIAFLLKECKEAAGAVADNIDLATNVHTWTDGAAKMNNPYFAQFSADNMSSYPEILLWRDYDINLSLPHSAGFYIRVGGDTGFTRQFVETFLMQSGLPIYASASGYKGDTSIENVRTNRDERLQLFMMTPGEILTEGQVDFVDALPILPNILAKPESRNVTGYQLRKGLTNKWSRDWNENDQGSPIFRAAEAYLNYMEASCMELEGSSIDAKATTYWQQLRTRAGLPADYNVTVSATLLNKENDWAVYSAGKTVSPLLYNIRRERRCELMQEGLRMDDLKRWRALDQLNATWQPEGVNLWNSGLAEEYAKENIKLVADGSDQANVSSPQRSTYLRPYEVMNKASNLLYNKGYNWCEAHYLSPISIVHFRNTATSPNDLTTSVIYQNPGWPLVADQGPKIK